MELFLNGLNNDTIFDGDDVVIDDWKYFCNPCELVAVQFLLTYCDGCEGSWIFVAAGLNDGERGWWSGGFIVWGEWAFERIYDFMFFDLYWFLVVDMLIPSNVCLFFSLTNIL